MIRFWVVTFLVLSVWASDEKSPSALCKFQLPDGSYLIRHFDTAEECIEWSFEIANTIQIDTQSKKEEEEFRKAMEEISKNLDAEWEDHQRRMKALEAENPWRKDNTEHVVPQKFYGE